MKKVECIEYPNHKVLIPNTLLVRENIVKAVELIVSDEKYEEILKMSKKDKEKLIEEKLN